MIIYNYDNDDPIVVPLAPAGPAQLAQLQKAVGGYIEQVPDFTSIEINGAIIRLRL
jgi:hypothetical protein